MNRFVRLAFIAGLAAGCKSNPLSPSDLIGPAWQLTSFQDGTTNPVTVASPSRYTLRFGADGRVAVMSDCNSCSGEYSLLGAVFRIGPLACTKAFCGATSLDPAFPAALAKARAVTWARPRSRSRATA
jgi:heat shock protein HslJ